MGCGCVSIHLGFRLAVVAAFAVASGCMIADIFKGDAPGHLVVSPATLTDFASAGTSQVRAQTLSIDVSSGTGVTWQASVWLGSPWLKLATPQGNAPSKLQVSLDATGLGP